MDASLTTRRWWRRLPARLSLRTLMVVVLALSVGLGWLIHRARVQREAIVAIERSGGDVAYRWEWSYGLPTSPTPTPPGPRWVREKLGPDFLDTVTYAKLHGEKCTDETLRAAGRLTGLEVLEFFDTLATDAGAEEIRHLTKLRSLDLRLNTITPKALRHIAEMGELRELKLAMRLSPVPLKDEDLAFLRRLTKLESLMLPSKDLTDAWLVYIEGLTNLTALQLYDMTITTEGLDHLKRLSNLTDLVLHGTRIKSLEPLRPSSKVASLGVAFTPIDDSALELLRDWPLLNDLDLRRTNITDAGMVVLGELPSLNVVDLAQTDVTDAGLMHLAVSPTLRWVSIRGTKITDAGIAAFSKANPLVKVSR